MEADVKSFGCGKIGGYLEEIIKEMKGLPFKENDPIVGESRMSCDADFSTYLDVETLLEVKAFKEKEINTTVYDAV